MIEFTLLNNAINGRNKDNCLKLTKDEINEDTYNYLTDCGFLLIDNEFYFDLDTRYLTLEEVDSCFEKVNFNKPVDRLTLIGRYPFIETVFSIHQRYAV